MGERIRPDTGGATAMQWCKVANWPAYSCLLVNLGKLTIGFEDASRQDK